MPKVIRQTRAQYDFSGGVRGKYYQRYVESSNVVVLEPNVHKRFKNSDAVNKALRSLIRAEGTQPGLAKWPARTRAKRTDPKLLKKWFAPKKM